MRIVTKIFLISLFVPLFLIGLLLANIKFQALNPGFWLNTFEERNVYKDLSDSFKKSSEEKIEKDGNVKDAEVLTNLITPENFRDVTSKNLTNLLDFMNGKTAKLEVYIPITKLPKDLLPTNYGSKPDTIPIAQLFKSFNITSVSESQIAGLSQTGFLTSIGFYVDIFLLLLTLVLFFVLTEPGKRLWAVATSFLLSGLVILGAFAFGEVIRQSMLTNWPKSSDPAQTVLVTFAPFIVEKIILVWLVVGITATITGIFLFFLKRPMYNTRR